MPNPAARGFDPPPLRGCLRNPGQNNRCAPRSRGLQAIGDAAVVYEVKTERLAEIPEASVMCVMLDNQDGF